MKTNITILIIAFLFVGQQLSAERIYTGYIVTNQGEKIEGKVYLKSLTSNELKVKFVNTSNKKHTYKAKQLQEYGFVMQKYNQTTKSYEDVTITYIRKEVEDAPVRFGTKDILIQRSVKGSINVYNQYIELDGKIGSNLEHFFYVEKENNPNFTKVTKENYKQILTEMVADYPELKAKVGSRGFGHKHIMKMAKLYNEYQLTHNNQLISMQD